MDIPAELHRRVSVKGEGRKGGQDVTVAKGPLVIMAHGLMAIDPAERGGFWITSEMGRISPAQAEKALLDWRRSQFN